MKRKPILKLEKRIYDDYPSPGIEEYRSAVKKIKALREACNPLSRLARKYSKDLSVQRAAEYVRSDIRNLRQSIKNNNPVTYEYHVTMHHPRYNKKFYDAFVVRDGQTKGELFKRAKNNIRSQIVEYRKSLKNLRNREYTVAVRGVKGYGRYLKTELNIPMARMKESFIRNNPFINLQSRGGGVHSRPNSFLNIKISKDTNEVFEPKKPKTKENHIGLELELFAAVSRDEMEAELIKRGLHKYVTWNIDNSIKPDSNEQHAHELAILMPENEYEKIVKDICGLLKDAHAKVNKSCGMHVHLDMRNRDRDVAFGNLVSAQSILYAMNPKSRLSGKYCKKTRNKEFNATGHRENRYKGINPEAFAKHGTIEVRIHAGTVSEVKILNWIRLLLKIVNKPDMVRRSASTFKAFVKQFDIDLDLATYIVERILKFNTPETQDVEEAA